MCMPGGPWRISLACALFKQETVVEATVEALIDFFAEQVDGVRKWCTKTWLSCWKQTEAGIARSVEKMLKIMLNTHAGDLTRPGQDLANTSKLPIVFCYNELLPTYSVPIAIIPADFFLRSLYQPSDTTRSSGSCGTLGWRSADWRLGVTPHFPSASGRISFNVGESYERKFQWRLPANTLE